MPMLATDTGMCYFSSGCSPFSQLLQPPHPSSNSNNGRGSLCVLRRQGSCRARIDRDEVLPNALGPCGETTGIYFSDCVSLDRPGRGTSSLLSSSTTRSICAHGRTIMFISLSRPRVGRRCSQTIVFDPGTRHQTADPITRTTSLPAQASFYFSGSIQFHQIQRVLAFLTLPVWRQLLFPMFGRISLMPQHMSTRRIPSASHRGQRRTSGSRSRIPSRVWKETMSI